VGGKIRPKKLKKVLGEVMRCDTRSAFMIGRRRASPHMSPWFTKGSPTRRQSDFEKVPSARETSPVRITQPRVRKKARELQANRGHLLLVYVVFDDLKKV